MQIFSQNGCHRIFTEQLCHAFHRTVSCYRLFTERLCHTFRRTAVSGIFSLEKAVQTGLFHKISFCFYSVTAPVHAARHGGKVSTAYHNPRRIAKEIRLYAKNLQISPAHSHKVSPFPFQGRGKAVSFPTTCVRKKLFQKHTVCVTKTTEKNHKEVNDNTDSEQSTREKP